jgi:transcription initiation factor TFIIB
MPKTKEEMEQIEKCPECNSAHLVRDYDRGELVCVDCGVVIEDKLIDQGPEWRAFDVEQGEKRARTGAPMTYTIHDKGLSTEISWKNKDSYGKSIPTRNRAQLYRLRKWQRRIRVSNATERNLAFALSELDRMASAMGLPRNVRETAAMIYRKAVNKNLIRGRSIEGVVAASLYAACRQCDVPRTLDEVANASRVGRKEIGRTYRFMTRELKLKLMPTRPQDYVSRFCSELKLSGEAQAKATDILRDASKKELTSGRGPTGVAAAAIYISSILCNERRTQREVADVAGVTEVTIRNRYKELTEKLGIEVQL